MRNLLPLLLDSRLPVFDLLIVSASGESMASCGFAAIGVQLMPSEWQNRSGCGDFPALTLLISIQKFTIVVKIISGGI